MKLTASARSKIPAGKFAGLNRSFPIPDRKHAKAAIMDAGPSERAGNISEGEEKVIKAKALRKLMGR